MKKFLLSLILLSTSPVFTSDFSELKEVHEASLRQQQIAMNDVLLKAMNSAVDKASTLGTNPVENFIITHPWYSVVGVAVCTFVAIKAWDYVSKSNKHNEDSDFAN